MSNPAHAEVDGVDVDAVAAAVRSCAAVDDLDGGPLGTVATYLPGRRLAGIRITADRVTVQIRGRWDVPVAEMGRQIRAAVATLVGARTVDIVVADLADPSPTPPALQHRPLPALTNAPTAPPEAEDNPTVWTKPHVADAPSAGMSSAPTTPTGVATPPNS